MPEGLEHIGKAAFCRALLTELTLPKGLKYIGDEAFYDTQLTKLELPEGLEHIGNKAFMNSRENDIYIKEIHFQKGLKHIGNQAFYNAQLTKLILPDAVEYIGDDAFANGYNYNERFYHLESLYISDNAKYIGGNAFGGNNELTYLSLPARILNGSIITRNHFYENLAESMDSLIIRGHADSIDLTVLEDYLKYVSHVVYPNSVDKIKTIARSEFTAEKSNVYDINHDGKMEFVFEYGDTYHDDENDDYIRFYGFLISNMLGITTDTLTKELPDYANDTRFFNFNNHGFGVYASDDRYSQKQIYLLTDKKEFMSIPIMGDDLICFEDINSDGRTDIITEDHIYLKQPDDTYTLSNINLIDTTQIDSVIFSKLSSGGRGPICQPASVAFSYKNVVSGVSGDAYTTEGKEPFAMDIDNNGYADIINKSNVLFNYGNNQFMKGGLEGVVVDIKDFNGDNVPDLVLYDKKTEETKLMYYNKNGQFTIQSLVKDLIISQAWSYDFDKDGDADILLAFNYDYHTGYSYLVMYRNEGNNQYTSIEQAFTEELHFLECKDIDNDGFMEILANKEDPNEDATSCVILEYDNLLHFSFNSQVYDEASTESVGDFDGDGKIEIICNKIITEFNGNTNTAPLKMEQPNILYDGANDRLEISWGNGQDAENSSVDLTYALRIGSEPGKSDILYAHATADGRRLNLRQGNMGYTHNYWFDVNSLPTGNYYIAVQAVDANFMGGPWSDETVYERKTLSAAFHLSTNHMTTADTLIISLAGKKETELVYEWNFGDSATVIQEEENRIYICYNTAGERTITMKVMDEIGNISEIVSQDVDVRSCKLGASKESNGNPYFDFNLDGAIDKIGEKGFYENKNDKSGDFVSVSKIFNLNMNIDLNPAYDKVIDYNMDGVPDFVTESNKGNIYINKRNSNFEYTTKGTDVYFNNAGYTNYDNRCFLDFNNDGIPDIFKDDNETTRQSIIILGATSDFVFGDTITLDYNITFKDAIDINRDGYTDIIGRSPYYEATPVFCFNKGNKIFDCQQIYQLEDIEGRHGWRVADMNNDGYIDIICHKTDLTIEIYYGDAEYLYSKTETIYLTDAGSSEITAISDIDNNGYPDLLGTTYIIYNYGYNNKIIDYNNNLQKESCYFTDINNDGAPDFSNEDGTYLNHTRITNTPPAVPTGLRVNQGAEGVMLAWDDSQDKETPITQMRYNISVKKKGATGEGAYIISPLNGGVDSAAISPVYHYLRSTRMTIPLGRFELGTEYEFCVQAIDAWNETSAMSEPVSFVFEGGEGITVSNYEVCIGEEITATFVSTDNNVPVWSSEDGYITETTDEGITVYWSEGGQKELTATAGGKTYTATINVKADTTDLSFQLPSMVLGGAPVHFTLPSAFSDPTKEIEIESEAHIQRRGTTLDAIAVFPERDGEYSITFRTSDRGQCGIIEHTQYVQVVGNNITPVISIVGIDETTGKNKIEWNVPDNVFERSDLFDQIWVYKEGSKTEEYIKLAELPLTATSYIDMSSDPSVRKSRYRITLHTTYGGESKPSATHSNVHVMLNKGLHNSVNIIWTKYEGAMIEQYTILKGTSPDNMSVLTTASGNETSYTDQNVEDEENVYYALSYSNTYETEWIPMNPFGTQRKTLGAGRATNVASGQSNIVTSGEIINTVFPTELNIMYLEATAELTPYQQSLHLYPELLPTNASIKQVTWNITAGNDLATIDDYGTLTYTGNGESGSVTVEAKTIDGSNLTKSIIIPIDWTYAPILVEEMTIIPNQIEITPENNNVQLTIDVQPAEATDKSYTWSVEDGYEGYVSISEDNILTGKRNTYDYITITATANDGSGISATAEVSITGLWDYPLTETINVYGIWEDSTSVSAEFPNTQLYADYTPSDAQPEISWSVIEGTDIITVDQNGYVTFLYEPGRAVVRASANDGSGVYDDYIVIGDITYVDTLKIMHDDQQEDDTIYLNPSNIYTYVWGEKIPSENEAAFSDVIWEFVAGDNSIVQTENEMVGWGLGLTATGKSGRTTLRATVDDKRAAYDEVEIVVSGFEPQINIDLTDSVLSPSMTTLSLYAWLTTYEWQEENRYFLTIDTPMDWEIVDNEEIAELTMDEWGNYNLRAKEKNGEITLRAFTTYNGVYYSQDTVINAKDFTVELESMEIQSEIDVLTPENPCLTAYMLYSPEDAINKEVDWIISNTTDEAEVQITESTDSTCVVCANMEMSGNGTFTLKAYKRWGSDLSTEKTFELEGFGTALNETEADKPIIYPTMTKAAINIKNAPCSCAISIRNSTGMICKEFIHSKGNDIITIDVSNLASGVYFISIKEELQKEYIYKFIKL